MGLLNILAADRKHQHGPVAAEEQQIAAGEALIGK